MHLIEQFVNLLLRVPVFQVLVDFSQLFRDFSRSFDKSPSRCDSRNWFHSRIILWRIKSDVVRMGEVDFHSLERRQKMIQINGDIWVLFIMVALTDLFLLGAFLFVKTRNEWRKK